MDGASILSLLYSGLKFHMVNTEKELVLSELDQFMLKLPPRWVGLACQFQSFHYKFAVSLQNFL